jgi:hypothetical protein
VPYLHTIQSLGGTGNTSQLNIGQMVDKYANKYNVELNAENQHLFEKVFNRQADERKNTISPSGIKSVTTP